MTKMRGRPPTSVEEFISGEEGSASSSTSKPDAERKEPSRRRASKLPWQEPAVRDDVLRTYNLRVPEPYLLKLRYIAEHTPQSMQQFCMGVLLPAIDKKIAELTSS